MKNTFLFLLTFIVLLLPVVTLAQVKYAPLIEIDGLTNSVQGESFSQYVNFLYGFSIAIAALLAVIKIIIAGVKYMLSSLPGTKGDAKTEIQGALLGLLLILGAYLILNTINPALTNTAIQFDQIKKQADIQTRPEGVRVSNLSPQQIGSQLNSGLNNCVQTSPPSSGSSGRTTVVTANASSCPANIQGDQLRIFQNNCTAQGGAIASGGTGNRILTCSVPVTGAASLSALGQSLPACVSNVSVSTSGGSDTSTLSLAGCTKSIDKEDAIRQFKTSCEAIRGGAFARNGDTLACAVPKATTNTAAAITTTGTVIQEKSTQSFDFSRYKGQGISAQIDRELRAARDTCQDSPKFGKYDFDKNTWKSICTYPKVISYSGNAASGSRDDCTRNGGEFDGNLTTANYCIIRK